MIKINFFFQNIDLDLNFQAADQYNNYLYL